MDNINPKHYKMKGLKFKDPECILFAGCMRFNLGNAFKYVWRAGEKGDAIEDLDKALWYLEKSYDTHLEDSKYVDDLQEIIRDTMVLFFDHLDFSECGEIGEKKRIILRSILDWAETAKTIDMVKELKDFIKSQDKNNNGN